MIYQRKRGIYICIYYAIYLKNINIYKVCNVPEIAILLIGNFMKCDIYLHTYYVRNTGVYLHALNAIAIVSKLFI